MGQFEWRIMPGWNYAVTRCGRVFNFVTGKEKIPQKNRKKDPYLCMQLWNEGKKNKFYVHRLVAEMWSDERRLKDIQNYEVNHIDGNSLNNHIDNLELVTRIENMKDMWARRTERKKLRSSPCPF